MAHKYRLPLVLMTLAVGVCLLGACQGSAQDRQIRRNPSVEPASVGAEKRTALVIGNGAYSADPLANPVNDARAVAAALRELGFDVSEKDNATEKEMLRSIDDFGQKLRAGGVGLFYYSGHGLQANGNNYMVPIGANIKVEQDIEYETVNVGRVLAKMEAAENRVNIVILDACRNNPYRRSFRSPSQGLAPMNAPSGTLIAYATSPGTVATDGPGMNNSPFTAEFLKQLQMTGLKVEDVFKRVGAGVQQVTGRKQIPWYLSSVVGDFYFKPGSGSAEQSGGASGTQLAGGQAIIERPQPEPQQPVVGTGSLKVDSNPAGAAVYVDGQVRGKAPTSVTGLSVGKVNVRVMLDGYKPQEKTIDVRYGKEVQASFILDREEKRAEQKSGQIWREPITGMEFVWVPGGCYHPNCRCIDDDTFGFCKAPDTCIEGFWLGRFEVTQGQWKQVMRDNPSSHKAGDNYPVDSITLDEAKDFVERLSNMTDGRYLFRLPRFSEWLYACRNAGRPEKCHITADQMKSRLNGQSWYMDNTNHTQPVGKKTPNELGLHDMEGNVSEWFETYDFYPDPHGAGLAGASFISFMHSPDCSSFPELTKFTSVRSEFRGIRIVRAR